jgi:hypothetical protein
MVLTIDVTGFLCVFLVKSLHEICMWEVEWQPWTFGMWTPLWGGWRHRLSATDNHVKLLVVLNTCRAPIWAGAETGFYA